MGTEQNSIPCDISPAWITSRPVNRGMQSPDIPVTKINSDSRCTTTGSPDSAIGKQNPYFILMRTTKHYATNVAMCKNSMTPLFEGGLRA